MSKYTAITEAGKLADKQVALLREAMERKMEQQTQAEWHKAKVKWYNIRRAYGFFTLDNTNIDVFFHISDLEKARMIKIPHENEAVELQYKQIEDGLRVSDVRLVERRREKAQA